MSLQKTLCAALIGAAILSMPVGAETLKPYQKEALEKLLKTVPADARVMAKGQFEAMLAPLSEAQVKAILYSMEQSQAEMDEMPDDADYGDAGYDDEDDSVGEASAEDLAYNEKQYEPVVRMLWEAQRGCDTFIADTLIDNMTGETFAVWGEAWRFEVQALRPTLSEAPAVYEQFAPSFRGMAPTDARYDFDFSKVKMTCDRGAIDAAIRQAFADYQALGQEFIRAVKAATDAGDFDTAQKLEAKAGARVTRLAEKIQDAVAEHGPNGSDALIWALMNGKPA